MNPSEFKSHPLLKNLEKLDYLIRETKSDYEIPLSDLQFFKIATSYFKSRLRQTIPELIDRSEIEGVDNELSVSINFINNYLLDGNSQNLVNSLVYIKNAYNRIANFPILIGNSDFDFTAQIIDFQDTANNTLSNLEKQRDLLETEIKKMTIEVERLAASLVSLQDSISETDKNVKASLTTLKEDYDETKKDLNNTFEDNQISYQQTIEDLKEAVLNGSKEMVDKLGSYNEEARTLVGIIGNVGITGNYQQIANKNEETANTWRSFALASMLVASILMIITIWGLSEDDITWQKALVRILGATILIYPATYASLESSKHRRISNENRRSELELASINPFIENLGDDQKKMIKEKLVEKYFGNQSNNASVDKTEEISLNVLERIIKLIISTKK